MADTGEHDSEPVTASEPSRPGADWFPQHDPVEDFGNTVEQALRHLSVELAGLRAERDGLRLELEGVRAQYELLRQQLADRDRFTSTVRELGDIVRHLSMPTRWAGDEQTYAAATGTAPSEPVAPPLAPPAGPAPEQAVWPFTPTVPEVDVTPAPPVWTPPADPTPPPAADATPAWTPPAPEAGAPPAWTPPAEPTPPAPEAPSAFSTWAPQAHGAVTQPAPEWTPPAPPTEPVPPEPEPTATWAMPAAEPVGASTDPVWATAPTEPVAPPAEPLPTPPAVDPFATSTTEPAPEPISEPAWDPIVIVEHMPAEEAADRVASPPQVERFFDQPGVWLGEPPRSDERRDMLRTWGGRLGTVLLGLLVVAILLISVGPRFLPYQTYFVRSGSMEPTIETGAMIFLTKTDASDLDEGDIISFERPDKPGTVVTHRIHAIESNENGRYFVTKGDANGSPDVWRVPANGSGWKYAFGIPKLGFVVGYLGTPTARLALLAIPAVLLGLFSLLDIWKPAPSTRPRRSR